MTSVMVPSSLPNEVVESIKALADEACSDSHYGLPCVCITLVGDGQSYSEELFTYCKSPDHHETSSETKPQDDIYWLASCTKLVTSIACMQLVEKNALALDDANIVEQLCPELREVRVLKDDGTLVDKKQGITLRMLLTHTSGFGYSFLDEPLRTFRQQRSPSLEEFDEFSGNAADFDQPLVDQPGQNFHYGISIDWAGILVERASGLKLDEYMSRHIFGPLQVRDLTMVPPAEMAARFAGLWQRKEGGELSPRRYPLRWPHKTYEDAHVFQSGGAGLFGSIRQFSKIVGALLNDGVSPRTGERILSTSSVDQMFANQLVEQPDFARRELPALKPDLVYEAAELYPLCPGDKPQGWGLGFMISPGVTGRSDDTAHWSGLSNVFWWCDRTKGVGGVVGSQVLPFVDPKAAELWVRVEQSLYGAMDKINKM